MLPADQIVSARNTPSGKPAGRCLPHLLAFAESRRPRQTPGVDDAGQAPRTPPCSLAAPGEPTRGRPWHWRAWRHAPMRLPPRGAGRKAPLLGRAPWAFGYGYTLPVALTCIKRFISPSVTFQLLSLLPSLNYTCMI